MKNSKSENKNPHSLIQSESGNSLEELFYQMGISETTFDGWRKRYGGLGSPELRHLRQLVEENAELKRLVADLSLDKALLQSALSKKRRRQF
nr:transposase [Burkholderia pseudomallei]